MIYSTQTREYAPGDGIALPEDLQSEGLKLLAGDAIVSLALVVVCAIFDHARSAWLAVFTLALVAAAFGRYRRSIARVPRDEWYATICVSLVASVVLCGLVPLFQVTWFVVAAVVVAWTALGSAVAAMLTEQRRSGGEAIATAPYLSPHVRTRSRSALTRGTIAILDFVLAAVAMVVLSPVLIVCAIAVAANGDGPVLFVQRRVGIDGREFLMYKFRTMRPRAGSEWVTENDDRVTSVGRVLRRTSLDELPQLWNVLRGEMSLVGPRPEMSEYADRFVHQLRGYEDRQAIPPGITGWAQLNYDRNFSPSQFENVLPYDLFYVANYSVSLYLFCLVKTVFEALHHRAL